MAFGEFAPYPILQKTIWKLEETELESPEEKYFQSMITWPDFRKCLTHVGDDDVCSRNK